MNIEEARAQARILKALANPARMMIVDELSRGDRCACDLLPRFDLDQSTLSRHLAQLKAVGIVSERREGVRVVHHLACPCILEAAKCTRGVLQAEARRSRRLLKAG